MIAVRIMMKSSGLHIGDRIPIMIMVAVLRMRFLRLWPLPCIRDTRMKSDSPLGSSGQRVPEWGCQAILRALCRVLIEGTSKHRGRPRHRSLMVAVALRLSHIKPAEVEEL
jgi:hypothetical protein